MRNRIYARPAPAICCIALLTLLLAAPATATEMQTAARRLSEVTQTHRVQLESTARRKLQSTISGQKRLAGQGQHVSIISVKFDPAQELLVVNLSVSYLPRDKNFLDGRRHIYPDFEAQLTELHDAIHELFEGIIQYNGTKIIFDGRELQHYYPGEFPSKRNDIDPSDTTTVAISAGHGFYYHLGDQNWLTQREEVNGIIEDFVTPDYASELADWIIARSYERVDTIGQPRSTATTTHQPSEQPWWKVSARYFLKESYPNNPEIWHSLAVSGSGRSHLLHYDEDIRSRPLFANHIGADTIIHFHSNAADNSSTRGTRAYVYPQRKEDARIAESILCYMKEQIRASAGYEDFPVASMANMGNHGENRLAAMPSVIVEVGFHTNPEDAAALQDPTFRSAAVKGVEKGYRLYKDGLPCQPFAITSIPDLAGPQNSPQIVDVNTEGYPQYPIRVEGEFLTCESGWTCDDFEKTVTEAPARFSLMCTANPPQPAATFRVRARFVDADNVVTNAADFNWTCTPSSSVALDVLKTNTPTASVGSR